MWNHSCNFEREHHGEHSCEVIWNLDLWFRRRCGLKYFLSRALTAPLFSELEPFVQYWKRASWGTTLWNYLKFEPVVQEEMPFKSISYLELWQPFCSGKRNHLCNFGKRISWGTILWNYFELESVVQEMSFNWLTKTDHTSSPWPLGSVELKIEFWPFDPTPKSTQGVRHRPLIENHIWYVSYLLYLCSREVSIKNIVNLLSYCEI